MHCPIALRPYVLVAMRFINWPIFLLVPLSVLKRRKASNSTEDLKYLQMYQAFPCEIWCYDQIPVWKEIWGNTSFAYFEMTQIGLFTLFSFNKSFSPLFFPIFLILILLLTTLLRCKLPTFSCWCFVNSPSFSHSEPNIATAFGRRSRRKVIAEQRTASSRLFIISLWFWIDDKHACCVQNKLLILFMILLWYFIVNGTYKVLIFVLIKKYKGNKDSIYIENGKKESCKREQLIKTLITKAISNWFQH